MPTAHDIVVIGSGHNGLVAAAYLASAGKSVLVLERNPWFGGGVVTAELTGPGYLHDRFSTGHIFIQGNPLIKNDELKLLSRYGLKYVYPEIPFMTVFEDGSTIGLYRDRQKNFQEIARFSKKDAETHLRFADTAMKYLPMISASFYTPPPPMGAMLAMMDQSVEGRELFAYMQKSPYDIILENFEDEHVRLFLMRMVSENLTGPEEKGTGIGIFVFLGFMETYGIGVAVGGSGALTASLIRCIEDHGGTVCNNTSVSQVIVKNGRASGVRTADGAEHLAKDAVIGSIHPHFLGKYVAGVEPRVTRDAARVELSANSCFTVHGALNEPLRFKAGPHVAKAYFTDLVPANMTVLRQYFDALRYGRIPDSALLGVACPSNHDPTRCPPGKSTFHIWDYAPYSHPDGGPQHWDKVKAAFAQTMIERTARFCENLTPQNIIAYVCDSPLDLERCSESFQRGDLHGAAPYLYQSGAHRPTPDLGQNTVPGIERLYLVGPFQHPGGGVFGAGRATAMKMCEDLKINFDKIGQSASTGVKVVR
ncbi:MAG TPA: NAD(P)/FAD-dependent oxidoreductase [Candidatus Dormibacteraeota bacterium]|nr:NAD(P)/FAD-dependent oxidoreductase [Candidatus Dormibacteraeota bacterium]